MFLRACCAFAVCWSVSLLPRPAAADPPTPTDDVGTSSDASLFQPPTPRQSAAARRWLKRFGLMDSAELPLFSQSAGLQRMTLLARALVKNPPLLILDEPCQGLDTAHRDLIIQTVDALIRGGLMTTIFVTHRPEEIPASIRQVLQLRHGAQAVRRRI